MYNRENLPYLARRPWVGLLIFLLAGAAFAFLTVQVIDKGPLTRWDMPIAVAMHAWAVNQPLYVVLPMRALSVLGREGLALIATALMVGWIIRKRQRELGMVIVGVMGGELAFEILSNLIGRQRPAFRDPFENLIGPGYPSGHATTAILLSWLILYLLWPQLARSRRILFTAILAVLVIGICFSRLFLGLHYLTDLVAGILLGLAWGGLVYTAIDLYFSRAVNRQVSAVSTR